MHLIFLFISANTLIIVQISVVNMNLNGDLFSSRYAYNRCQLPIIEVYSNIVATDIRWYSYFSFQPVLHDWYYPVCGMVHIKEPLLLIEKSSPCDCSGYLNGPLLLINK